MFSAPRFLRFIPLLMLVVSLPWIVSGVAGLKSNSSDVAQWLPENRATRRTYAEFVELFGADDFLLVSWPGCTFGDVRLEQLKRELTAPVDDSQPRLIDRVVTGPELVRRLVEGPAKLSAAEAKQRLTGILVGPDRQLTGLIVQLTDHGRVDQKATVEIIRQAAARCSVTGRVSAVGRERL